MSTAPSLLSQDATGRLQNGRNCWRMEHAERARLIVDADDYFSAARAAMLNARQRIMMIGWDFDTRIRIGNQEHDTGTATVGSFILWLARRRPELEIYLLRWNFGALKALFRGSTPITVAKWALNGRIHIRLDSAHPVGASHHQKIVVVDDSLAFCGGIDMTGGRWDTRAHADDDPRRLEPGGTPCGPWHDATMALEGPVAAALGELARDRWACAGGERLNPVRISHSCWPDMLEPHFEDVRIAVSRTRPDHGGVEAQHEIEQLYLDLIARARRFIYAESQYFASRRIAEAIAKRLAEPEGPEIVLVNPEHADGWLEQTAMDTARARIHQSLQGADPHGRFRIYHPFTEGGTPIYVHAKIMVVDDEVLRVGSSNWNNRSMRLDTECDVTIDATLPENRQTGDTIRELRNGLMAEHLGVPPEQVAAILEENGSLIRTIEQLRGNGRSLRPYVRPELSDAEKFIADHEALDPEGPEAMFEPLSHRSLLRRLPRPSWKTTARTNSFRR